MENNWMLPGLTCLLLMLFFLGQASRARLCFDQGHSEARKAGGFPQGPAVLFLGDEDGPLSGPWSRPQTPPSQGEPRPQKVSREMEEWLAETAAQGTQESQPQESTPPPKEQRLGAREIPLVVETAPGVVPQGPPDTLAVEGQHVVCPQRTKAMSPKLDHIRTMLNPQHIQSAVVLAEILGARGGRRRR